MTNKIFSVTLHAPAQGGAPAATTDKLAELLEKARSDGDFDKAKNKYEFRLRQTNGTTTLELRRTANGLFAKLFGRGKERRSSERLAARDALRAAVPDMSARNAGLVRRNEARTIAAEAMTNHYRSEQAKRIAAMGPNPFHTEDKIPTVEDAIAENAKKRREAAAERDQNSEFRMHYAPGTVTSHQRVKV
jgi:hypothetical protein